MTDDQRCSEEVGDEVPQFPSFSWRHLSRPTGGSGRSVLKRSSRRRSGRCSSSTRPILPSSEQRNMPLWQSGTNSCGRFRPRSLR